MPDVRANGVRLYHEVHGAGDTILCIHGTSSSAMMWREAAIESLAALGQVIIYDRRGCTRSERPEPYETSVPQHADDAAALLETLDAHPAVIIGRSYGGAVALDVALRYPHLVRALALLEPGDITLDGEASHEDDELRDALEAAASRDVSTVAETLLRQVLGDAAWESFPEELRGMFRDNSPAVLAEVRGAGLSVSTVELSRIGVPVLVVAGAESPAQFRRLSERLADGIPGARGTIVGGGHLIDPEGPEVLSFVRSVLAEGGSIGSR
ncbi:alpha/beta hydrolase [soil metagenome]